jgi:ABC-2 type transport system permease protein
MRNKLGFLIGVSLKKKIKSKWFLIANIVIALLIIGITNIDSVITFFGGDFDNKTNIYIIDETDTIKEDFKQSLKQYEANLYGEDSENFIVNDTDKSPDEIIELIKNEENNSLFIEIYYDESNDISARLVSLSTIDSYDYQIIVSALNATATVYNLSSMGLTEEQYNKIMSGIKIDREILDEDITSEDENMEMIMTTVFPAFILPFFMLTILLIQFIGTEINDEKSTRSMEIIISNVSPRVHFAAKIISNNLFIIGQVVLMIIYAIIGLNLRTSVGGNQIVNGVGSEVSGIVNNLSTGVLANKLVPVIIFTLILMILTFIAYSLIAGILASMTTNAEDYQHVQTPLVIVLLLGYYLATMAGLFEGSTFIKVLSFFPLVSAILSPSLLVLGQIGVTEIIVSIVIMLITIYLLVKYGIRIYKVGILNYSSSGMWKKMFKSLRNKD